MTFSKSSKAGMFLSHVLPAVIRPMRVLWNEVIGFVFIILAIWAAPSVYRNWRSFASGEGGLFQVLVSVAFALLMAYFGITSFLRARKI